MIAAAPSCTSEAAKAAVARAITRGVLLPKDTGAQARWIAAITKDGGMIEMLDRFPGAPALAGRITPRIERRK